MRILLALMFFTPIVLALALFSGVERVTPILILMSLAAFIGQVYVESRKRGD